MDKMIELMNVPKMAQGKVSKGSSSVTQMELMIRKSFGKQRITKAGGVLVENFETESSDEDFELEPADHLPDNQVAKDLLMLNNLNGGSILQSEEYSIYDGCQSSKTSSKHSSHMMINSESPLPQTFQDWQP